MPLRLTLLLVLLAAAGGAAWWWAARPPLVQSAEVVTGPAVEAVYATGTVEPVIWARIGPVVKGRLMTLAAEEGARVRPGDVLARLDDTVAQAQVQEAEARATFLREDAARLRALAAREIVARAALERAESEARERIGPGYFPVAEHLRLLDPEVVLVVGPRGSGKTEIARVLTDAALAEAVRRYAPAVRLPPGASEWLVAYPNRTATFEVRGLKTYVEYHHGTTESLRDLWFTYLVRLLVARCDSADRDRLAPVATPPITRRRLGFIGCLLSWVALSPVAGHAGRRPAGTSLRSRSRWPECPCERE